ncbi:MAG TPA: hypothetical protein VK308_15145 [Pyrinomonadaceae bacterium]|nr:hypothetical protein [Pyrinomonadaceae bacterium]
MNVTKYKEQLKDLPFYEITIGYTTIHLFTEAELSEGQIGYSVDSKGNSFIGNKDDDWKKNWFVIGFEDLCGDPMFIDLDSKVFPVFTSIHGTGNWEQILIADSFESFIKSLKIIAELKPKEETLEKIKSLNQQADSEFWELLFEED